MDIKDDLQRKIKDKIVQELNKDLYRYLNMDLYDADHFFGYYNGYIYKLIDRVYNKYGPHGLRLEIKHIVQYLIFLMNKLENNSRFEDFLLVINYFRLFYKHHSYRKTSHRNQLCFDFGTTKINPHFSFESL